VCEQVGALFLLLWDNVPRRQWRDTTIVLLNRVAPPAALLALLSQFKAVLLVSQLATTCFAHVIVGTGCRALWWQSDRLAFDIPVYADFLAIAPPPAAQLGFWGDLFVCVCLLISGSPQSAILWMAVCCFRQHFPDSGCPQRGSGCTHSFLRQ
jgi:hypothetical protein